jgi:tetratricopeptide (TPR) repeat protein|tara:strand:+ start:1601 stop:1957 length:357 start_codon:yes stop_codon:yes gene_type:complete
MKKYIYSFLIIIIFSCKSDSELSIERGIHFYDWGKYNEAIVEFNKSKFYQLNQNNQSYEDLKLLAQIYYNLAITYAKIDMYDLAYNEAQHAVSLVPNKEYREVLDLIKAQLVAQNSSN